VILAAAAAACHIPEDMFIGTLAHQQPVVLMAHDISINHCFTLCMLWIFVWIMRKTL